MSDRYIDGTCPMTCPNYKVLSESIAEYQRIEKTLEAKVAALELDNKRLVDKNLEWLDAWNIQEAQVKELGACKQSNAALLEMTEMDKALNERLQAKVAALEEALKQEKT